MNVKEPPFGTSLDPRQRCTVAIVTVIPIVATVSIVVNIEILEYFGALQGLGFDLWAQTCSSDLAMIVAPPSTRFPLLAENGLIELLDGNEISRHHLRD